MKQYQNISYKELLSCSENNPNRTRSLDSIEIPIKSETSLENIGLKGYKSFNLNPSGILSLITCINDTTYYSILSTSARIQLNIDMATKLQQQTDPGRWILNVPGNLKKKNTLNYFKDFLSCATFSLFL